MEDQDNGSPLIPPQRSGKRSRTQVNTPTDAVVLGPKRLRLDNLPGPSTSGSHSREYRDFIVKDSARVQNGDQYQYFFGSTDFGSGVTSAPTSTLEDVLESLRFERMNARFLGLDPRLERSCEWLYDRVEHRNWRSSKLTATHHGCLWIKGKPGSGKTTLMKMAADNDKSRNGSHVVISHFFYRASGDSSAQTMYRNLLYQLLERLPRLRPVLEMWKAANLELKEWPVDLLKSIFRTAVSGLDNEVLTCYIDALDECDDKEARRIVDFFEDLADLTVSNNVRFLLCLSTRHYPRITMSKCLELELDYQDGHNNDITRYVKSKLKVTGSARKRLLARAICERAAGVFLWVKLAVNQLNAESDGGNSHRLHECLNTIPEGLPEFFELIIRKDILRDPAFIPTIQWTLFSQRPLKREELYCAVQTCLGHTDSTAHACEAENMEKFILRSSKGFVELVKGKQPTIQFIHETVREVDLWIHLYL